MGAMTFAPIASEDAGAAVSAQLSLVRGLRLHLRLTGEPVANDVWPTWRAWRPASGCVSPAINEPRGRLPIAVRVNNRAPR